MLGKILKDYRLQHNLSQTEMAKLLQTTQPYYSLFETGKRKPSYKLTGRIANLFNIAPATVVSWINYDNNK